VPAHGTAADVPIGQHSRLWLSAALCPPFGPGLETGRGYFTTVFSGCKQFLFLKEKKQKNFNPLRVLFLKEKNQKNFHSLRWVLLGDWLS
jgi:hypothetical protein